MVKYRKELSTDTKEAIISLYNSGIKQSEISRRLSIAKTTISDILKDLNNVEVWKTRVETVRRGS